VSDHLQTENNNDTREKENTSNHKQTPYEGRTTTSKHQEAKKYFKKQYQDSDIVSAAIDIHTRYLPETL
jgi:hypothetical protein